MSTPFYDLASLVVVPSGYKASKVYAQKPLTTDGQLTFSRASTATRVNSAGLIETVSSNVPRLDYLGSTCPKLQLEPQRVNLKLYSEDFSTAAGWSALTNGDSSVTFTANYGVSPDGYQNADRLQLALNTGSFVDWLSYNAVTIGTTYTYSIYAKSLSGSVDVEILGGTPTGNIKKTITTEWTRLTHTFTATSVDLYPRFLLQAGTSSSADILVWGAQLEAGAYATSYIPTTTAAVTRLADACSKTGISSLIGQTEGTLFVEMSPIGSTTSYTERVLRITGGTDEVGIQRYGDSRIVAYGVSGGVTSWAIDVSGIFSSGQVEKIAIAYKLNDVALYVNGVLIGTDTSAAMFTSLANLFFANDASGNLIAPQNVKQALLFKTRLTNAQLAELTTL